MNAFNSISTLRLFLRGVACILGAFLCLENVCEIGADCSRLSDHIGPM